MAPSRKNDEIIDSIYVFIIVYVYCLYVCLLVGGWCGVCGWGWVSWWAGMYLRFCSNGSVMLGVTRTGVDAFGALEK